MAIILAKPMIGGKAIIRANLKTIMINTLEAELMFTCDPPQSDAIKFFSVNQIVLETANSAIFLRACVNSLAGSSSSALQA